MIEKLIEVNKISKKMQDGKREFTILNNISFSVYKGEMLAITGKSGSGKSTLLSVLAGLDPPTEGEVKYRGEDIYKKREKELEKFRLHQIGLIFQNYNLINELTCIENIEVPRIFSNEEDIETDKIMMLLDKLELMEKKGLYPAQMSGGEQQRVALARAIVNEPTVVFADEPTGSLDTKNADNIIQILQDLKEKRKTTIVIVTHDMDIANRCDRKLVMTDGKMALE